MKLCGHVCERLQWLRLSWRSIKHFDCKCFKYKQDIPARLTNVEIWDLSGEWCARSVFLHFYFRFFFFNVSTSATVRRDKQTTIPITGTCWLCQSQQKNLALALSPCLCEAVPKTPHRRSQPIDGRGRERGLCYADEKREKDDTWLVDLSAGRGGRQQADDNRLNGRKDGEG